MPAAVVRFIDQLWHGLALEVPTPDCVALNEAIDQAVIDEQGADNVAILVNLYLYAVADLLMFFSQGGVSLLAARTAIFDAWEYQAAQHFLIEEKGSRAVILTQDEEQRIKDSTLCRHERDAQRADRQHAEGITQWCSVRAQRWAV